MRRSLLLLVVVFMVAGTTVAAPAQAASPPPPPTVGIRLTDAPTNRTGDPRALEYIVDHVAQGTTITRQVEVSNNTGATQLVQLYPAAATITNGSFQFGAGRAANDLTSWTTVDPPTVSPASGAKSLATVTIAVPANAASGERYGVVWAQLPAAVPAGGGVAAVNRVGIRIYLSVGSGAEPASDFAITSFEARRDAGGNPLVAATVRNTGGRALDLSGELNLTKGPGGLSAGPFEANLGTTLGIGQTEPVTVNLDRAIPNGPWEATIVVRSGAIQHQATATITFPAAAASSSKPVAVTHPAGTSVLVPVLVAVAVVLVLLLLLLLLLLRRRRPAREP